MDESVNNVVLRQIKIQSVLALKSPGGGRTPFNGTHREAPPKKGYQFQASRIIIKGWRFHQLKFMKREGNLSEKVRKELTEGYGCEKVDKISWFCDLSERFTITANGKRQTPVRISQNRK